MNIRIFEVLIGVLVLLGAIPYIAKQYISAYVYLREKTLASRLTRKKMAELNEEE